jgi:hypothetical protein
MAGRRQAKRAVRAAEVSERAEAKALAACADGWAPFPGSGVQLATLRRLVAKRLIELHSEVANGRITTRFRKLAATAAPVRK